MIKILSNGGYNNGYAKQKYVGAILSLILLISKTNNIVLDIMYIKPQFF